MNAQLQKEMLLLLNIDNKTGTEAIGIMSVISNILNSDDYITALKTLLDSIFSGLGFSILVELSQVLLAIIGLNKNVAYRSNIPTDDMKYIIYAVIYYYLMTYQPDILNAIDIGSFRVLYSNCWNLIELSPAVVAIAKQGCFSCISLCKSGIHI